MAEIGGYINWQCVRPVEYGGSGSGGLEFVGNLNHPVREGIGVDVILRNMTGTNSRMVLVIFQPGSDFDRSILSLSEGEVAHMDEDEDTGGPMDDGYDAPPGPKRIKTASGSVAATSSIEVGTLYSTTQAISANIGSGWSMRYTAVNSILPVLHAAQQLVAFYEFVVEEASLRIKSGATEVKKLAFTLGSLSLSLTANDVIHWDWIVEFAMSMEDATNLGNPIQYASTVTSNWQQNTIKAELLFDGAGAT
ncbi:MAG: hypothetical protein LQ346_005792 [Caloplaca aetnensis]|nr:MAG: hypothetical protein LQ346_005792 [Caloplaca aetnensis]